MNKIITISALFIAFSLTAQDVDSIADNQTDLRLNPEIENESVVEAFDYSEYPFIKLQHNKINLNGDDWTCLGEKFSASQAGNGKFTVVYLGDSHVQADFGGE